MCMCTTASEEGMDEVSKCDSIGTNTSFKINPNIAKVSRQPIHSRDLSDNVSGMNSRPTGLFGYQQPKPLKLSGAVTISLLVYKTYTPLERRTACSFKWWRSS